MAFGDADLNMVMGDVFSVAITYGAQTATGIFNQASQLAATGLDGGFMNINETTVDIQSGDLTSLQQDSAITVDGTSYQIRDTQVLDDGKITRIWLSA